MTNLNEKDIARFKGILSRQCDTLRQRIHSDLAESDRENLSQIVGEVRDPVEESLADATATGNLTMLKREVRELRGVEAALARIREGRYGECAGCGHEIERARLEANPTAERCVQCQSRYERELSGGGDISPSI